MAHNMQGQWAEEEDEAVMEQTRIKRLQSQVDGVKEILTHNVDAILERGERVEDLTNKIEGLRDSGNSFNRTAGTMARSYWWKNVKLVAVIVVIALIIILIIILLALGVIPTNPPGPPPPPPPAPTKPPGGN